MAQSMFERYGGFASVSQIVSTFYDKIIDSPVTSPYFTSVDMKKLIDHQTKFVAYLMGGPASYTNDHIERVHAHMGITTEAFNEAVTLLDETLEESGVTVEDRHLVRQALHDRKSFIVTRP